jgi:hypothetical protein
MEFCGAMAYRVYGKQDIQVRSNGCEVHLSYTDPSIYDHRIKNKKLRT